MLLSNCLYLSLSDINALNNHKMAQLDRVRVKDIPAKINYN